jgi:hypothetical protein
VPLKVAREERPSEQLEQATSAMRALVEACWHHEPAERPSFLEVVRTLEAMLCGGAE